MPHETAFQPPSRPLVAIAAFAMVAAYANGLRGTFLMDDVPEIVNNEAIRTLWPPWVPMFEGGRLAHGPLPALVVPLAAVTKARNACYDSRLALRIDTVLKATSNPRAHRMLACELKSGIHRRQGPAAMNWSPWEIFPPGPGHSSRSILRAASRARLTSPRACAAA
jgi:hypothetical protein